MDGGRAPFTIHDGGSSPATFLIVSEPEQLNSAKFPPFCATVCVVLVRAAVCGAHLAEPWQILRIVRASAKISLNGGSIGPAELGPEFSIPMFVFQGEEDFTATALARHYVESLKAPRKEFVPIKGAGHFAVFIRSDQFLQELIMRVRPLAVGN